MGQKPENPPAFPHTEVVHQSWGKDTRDNQGMTLRDYFAAQALVAIIRDDGHSCELNAAYAYQSADAMLKQREAI